MSRRAIILAGGRGMRLRPYTVVLPKPLMPIGDFPILEVIVRQLKACGFDHITLAVNHQAELIAAFFGDGAKWGLKIDYSREDKPLGTMGPLKLIPDLPADLAIRHEGWINASPRHAMNAPHDHPTVFWSGCYYVQVPTPDDPDDGFSGALEFIDPRGAIGSTARVEAPFTRKRFTFRPRSGTCLLWPAFLKHWVHPNRSDEERVSAAFNSWFVRKA